MYGNALGEMFAYFLLAVIVVSAIVGWALIEGIIWLFHHISFVLH